jgi:ribonuclease P protein component
MREALRRHVEMLPAGCDLILHPRRGVLTIEFGKLEAEIVRILQQAQAEVARLNRPCVEPVTRRAEFGAAKPGL